MALARQVFHLQDVAGVKHPFGAVADAYLHLTGKDDNVLELGIILRQGRQHRLLGDPTWPAEPRRPQFHIVLTVDGVR